MNFERKINLIKSFQSRELLQIERLLPPNDTCCENALLCAYVSLNSRIVLDKRPFLVHGVKLKFIRAYKLPSSLSTTNIYSNRKKTVWAKIKVDYRGRSKAAIRYSDGRWVLAVRTFMRLRIVSIVMYCCLLILAGSSPWRNVARDQATSFSEKWKTSNLLVDCGTFWTYYTT